VHRNVGRQPLAHIALRLFGVLVLVAGMLGCAEEVPPGPFEVMEDQTWQVVNRGHRGEDGIYLQATWRTFAYEIARSYERAERQDLDQGQLESRLRELIHSFIDARYPMTDGTDINNLYLQYLVYINDDFDPTNPLQKAQFDAWRSEYVRRLMGRVYDIKYPLLRDDYDERWGRTLYSRLVFSIYLDNTESDQRPYVADIGEKTFLVDEEGNRYSPSGTSGPYPYEFDRPEKEYLDGKLVYRLFFPNRREDRKTPIVTSKSKHLELLVEGVGGVPVRTLRWDLPLTYPEAPARRLGMVPVIPEEAAATDAPD
jgi:hypothetical protein